ncbi:MAG: 30S ribosomal protein S12 methylthiotransferase RimO [Eubacteriales bacterium]|nr:30S ribosomal protein S12 methylthiotransferase RimO [Eubacteriales bacterium]
MVHTFYLLTLGCAKNEVDAEAMSSLLRADNYTLVEDPAEADFLIVNTCGFIEAAKREAIDAILDLAEIKQERLDKGEKAYLVVTGCLSQRYPEEIREELPEVDLVLGTAEYQLIAEECHKLWKQGSNQHLPQGRGSLEHLKTLHMPSTDRPYAYLKISEGCSNGCAFCAIPGIRGGQKSRPIEELVAEATYYGSLGFKELILIAQDTTRYGSDLYGKNSLVDLLKALLAIPDVPYLRLMYVYGDSFSDELIYLMASEERILPYLDMPIQHASDRILHAMRRRETQSYMRELFGKLRANIPGLMLRSTVMVGFPGEEETDFEQLLAFVEEIRFDRLGSFIFSPEEGTLAAKMEQQVDPKLAQERYDRLMTVQAQISENASKARIGKSYPILIDGVEENGPFFLGRSYGEAPEIDPQIYILAQKPDLEIGDIVECKIVDADTYSLTALTVAQDW